MLFILSLALLVLAVRLLRNYLRLKSIPGPFLAQFTDLWRSRAQNSPNFGFKMLELHRKYGPLVRTGPNFVSVSDPAAVPIIYGSKPVWLKVTISMDASDYTAFGGWLSLSASLMRVQASSYDAAILVSNGRALPSVITMTEEQHTSVRRVAGRAFSTGELLDYEIFIDETAAQLVATMREKRNLDITLWFQCFAAEVVNRISFTDKIGFLDKGTDIGGLMGVAVKRFDYWNKWAALPALEWVLAKSPVAQMRRQVDSPLARVSRQKMVGRLDEKSANETSPDLLQKLLEGKAKHPGRISDDDILGVVMSILSAGADTTASTIVIIFYFLLKHPEVLAKLRAEIDTGMKRGEISNPPRWKEVYLLPYLEAVVKETMRYFPPFAFGIDRVVPAGGTVIAGVPLPAGAEVGAQVESLHRDYCIFGKDADTYRPDRWIEASDEQRSLMERSFLGFSTGKRVCLGMHIAILEMKKVIPLVLMNFDVSTSKIKSPNQRITDILDPARPRFRPRTTERNTCERCQIPSADVRHFYGQRQRVVKK